MIDTAANALADAASWVWNAVGDAREAIENFFDGFDLADWLLLLIGVAVIVLTIYFARVFRRLRRTRTLGPVAVNAFKSAPAHIDVGRLVAKMQERLNRAGIQPEASVPSGSPEDDFIAAVSASTLPQAKAIGKLLAAIRGMAQRVLMTGYIVDGTLMQRRHSCGITVVVTERKSGRTERINTFWGSSFEEAVGDAADAVFVWISINAPEATAPWPWARWTDSQALTHYQEGVELEQEEKFEEARKSYAESARKQMSNALPRLRHANLAERRARKAAQAHPVSPDAFRLLLDAFTRYAECKALWPSDLHEPRYRLATMCGFDRLWADAWQARHESPDTDELARLQRLVGEFDGTPDGNAIADVFRDRADAEWADAMRAVPSGDRTLRRAVHLARICSRVQSGTATKRDLRRVRRWGRGRATSSLHYNAACFYSLVLAYEGPLLEALGGAGSCADEAIAQLSQVITDASAGAMISSMRDDPDLQPLRLWLKTDDTAIKNPLYGPWEALLG